jgi:acyl-CoA synthetase (AMP-forming)/AMP-acid ligase II
MIISGGVNIYPIEIEDLLMTHPKILEVAVIGIPDEKWGESLLAAVVPKGSEEFTVEEIEAFCEGKIARFKIPHFVQNVRELPKSPAGKVLKRIIREPYWKDSEARV